jgi:hypothetical protein
MGERGILLIDPELLQNRLLADRQIIAQLASIVVCEGPRPLAVRRIEGIGSAAAFRWLT